MRLALFVLGVCTTGACSTPPRPFDIVYVDAPATVAADSNGTYPLYVIVEYSGADSPPVALLYGYPSLNIKGEFPFISPGPVGSHAEGFPLSLPADAAKGPFQYTLSLRAESGQLSNQVTESVAVQ